MAGLVLSGCNSLTGAGDLEMEDGSSGGAGPGAPTSTGSSEDEGGAGGGAGNGGVTTSTSTSAPSPCEGVDCGPNGHCAEANGAAACACDPGFHAEGWSCVADTPGCACDADATCDAGVCTCNAGLEWSPGAGCDTPSAALTEARAELIQIATGELGQCEGAVPEQNRPYMQSQPGLWCYDFLAWVYSQGTHGLWMGTQYTAADLASGWRPGAGDIIKFKAEHWGMVVSASADGQTIYTIEGNVNWCVMQRTVSMGEIDFIESLIGEL